MWTQLPRAIPEVVVPPYFSPSTFRVLAECPLAVLATREHRLHLPPRPLALLGTILHHVVAEIGDGRWPDADGPRAAYNELLRVTVAAAEAHLITKGWGRLVPLERSVGQQVWAERVCRARRWVVRDAPERSVGPPRPLALDAPGADSGSAEPFVGSGREALIVWPAGRIRGRADRVERDAGTPTRVFDYKSGGFESEQLRRAGSIQLGLYGLAIEAVVGGDIELVIEGDERVELPWAETSARARAALDEATSLFPLGARLSAEALARPGLHCRFCELRPACAVYLRDAPALWGDAVLGGRMPLDVWGIVRSSELADGLVHMEVKDASGCLIVVQRLAWEGEFAPPAAGQCVYLFDLLADEVPLHAERRRPVNLRDQPRPGASIRQPAWGFRGFFGANGATG